LKFVPDKNYLISMKYQLNLPFTVLVLAQPASLPAAGLHQIPLPAGAFIPTI